VIFVESKVKTTAGILVAASILVGCGQNSLDICPKSKPMRVPGNSLIAIESQWDGCVADWSLRLANAKASVGEISEVVVAKCENYSAKYGAVYGKSADGITPQMVAEQTDVRRQSAKDIAHFEIMVAQSGNCKPTSSNTG
jgi:hypothetical protein